MEKYSNYKLPGCVMFLVWTFAGCVVYPLLFGDVFRAVLWSAFVFGLYHFIKASWWADDARLERNAKRWLK